MSFEYDPIQRETNTPTKEENTHSDLGGRSMAPPTLQLQASDPSTQAAPLQLTGEDDTLLDWLLDKAVETAIDLGMNALYNNGMRDEDKITDLMFKVANPSVDLKKLTRAQRKQKKQLLLKKVRPFLKAQKKREYKEIGDEIKDNQDDYGVSKADMKGSQVLYKPGIRSKAKFFNDPEFQANMDYTDELMEKDEVKKTNLGTSEMARDKGLVLSFLSRETGTMKKNSYYATLLKNPEKYLITAGSDVHKRGKAGYDYAYKYQKKHFDAAGEDMKPVPQKELKEGKKDRKPAKIKAKNILFATMGLVANCETKVKGKLGSANWDKLDTAAKRIWIAVAFARPGGGLNSQIEKIKKYYDRKGEKVDYNSITNSKIAGTSGVLKRAKNLALRATVFEKIVK